MRWMPLIVLMGMGFVGFAGGLCGCLASQRALLDSDPLLAMLDESLSERTRAQAVGRVWDEVEAGSISRKTARESIKSRLLWRGGPSKVRVAGVDALLRDETPEGIADNQAFFGLFVPTEGDYAVIGRIASASVERGWTSVTPGLVRSLSRSIPAIRDDERVEADALRTLYPDRTLVDTIFAVFMMTEEEIALPFDLAEKVRADAYELLGRLDSDGSERARLLAQVPPERASADELLSVLAAGARDLGVVPLTRSELEWLQALWPRGSRGERRWWEDSAAAVSNLTESQKSGLNLRHVEPVRWAAAREREWLSADFESLYEQLEVRLAGCEHYRRTDGRGGEQPTWENLERWRDQLVWGDLAAMLVVDEALAAPAVRAALFDFVERDRADTTTEYGGVLAALPSGGDEEWGVWLYPPRPAQRRGDGSFVASSQMFDESARSLAHFHFHASKVNRAKYAGPGAADREYADRHGRTCVVLTSIDRDTLNVDCYVRGGPIVDLGVIRRPKRSE